MDADEEADLVLAQTAILLDRQGDREAAQLLADATYLDFENTDDSYRTSSGTHVYVMAAVLYVDHHLVSAFTGEVRERIAPVLIDVALGNGYTAIDRMYIKQVLPTVSKGWRDSLKERAQERPTNQARRERLAPNHPVEDGLALGSRQEHEVYLALKQIQATTPPDRTIAIAPLPGVRLQAGHTWTPDTIVLGNGRAVVFEVDGPHHRDRRRYADDRNRDLQWQRCGIQVVRLPVEDLQQGEQLTNRLKEELSRHLWPR
ncbi:hypothetical protein ACH49O_41195 [Streptomyces coeruleorubidus]|uniref:hypothetical protein n=1 Tax=Streptomyces coeruleorubidus TaxID=116188 RepID=UPI003411B51E